MERGKRTGNSRNLIVLIKEEGKDISDEVLEQEIISLMPGTVLEDFFRNHVDIQIFRAVV